MKPGSGPATKGKVTEREACRLLSELGGWDVKRRANEGIREDISDLIGVPDCAVQVTAVRKTPAAIWARARTKIADVEQQRQRLGATHSVVLLRIDGGVWRALISEQQRHTLGGHRANDIPHTDVTPGSIIHWAPNWAIGWEPCGAGIWVNTIEWWTAELLGRLEAAA